MLTDCTERCEWNQGDYCVIYDIRNTLAEISTALKEVIQNAEK